MIELEYQLAWSMKYLIMYGQYFSVLLLAVPFSTFYMMRYDLENVLGYNDAGTVN